MLLIGSQALAIRAPELLRRRPRDVDYVCSHAEYQEWRRTFRFSTCRPETKVFSENKLAVQTQLREAGDDEDVWVEFELFGAEGTVANDSTSAILHSFAAADSDTIRHTTREGPVLIPSLNVLFALKKSHRFLRNSPHFWKTLGDYHQMKAAGARVPDSMLWEAWFKRREAETYNYKHPSLNQDKKGFFSGDQVPYVWDHDSVHEAVMLGVRPAYTYFQKDGAQVAVDRAKFEALPRAIQLASVVEEAMVLAVERSLVPHPSVLTPDQAWKLAFSKVLTSITSGWWREWAYENALDALRLYTTSGGAAYWNRFQAGIASGQVKPYESAGH